MTEPSPLQHSDPKSPRSKPLWRTAGFIALGFVLALAFLGHLSPEMKLQWENLMTLCGF